MTDFGPLGGVKVTGFISPTDTNDTYAVIDPWYGIDGLRNYSGGTSNLDMIPELRRRAGMIVGLSGGTEYYKLNPSPWNYNITDWTPINFGGGDNFANTDLTLDGDRRHSLDGNDLFISGASNETFATVIGDSSSTYLNTFIISDTGILLLAGNPLTTSSNSVFVTETNLTLTSSNSSNDTFEINFLPSIGLFQISDEINNKGIDYTAKYHANYTDRTLVDKEYVDISVSTSTVNNLSGLTDTNLSSLNSGDTLTYVNNTWVNLSTVNIYLNVSFDGQTYFSSQLPTQPSLPSQTECWVNGQKQRYGVIHDFVLSGSTSQDFVWVSSDFDLNTTDEINVKYK